ncbi:MAG: hypothetical protein U9N33_08500 [Campylobacterota bacterium]|nr:hypothetical protein [Campylobacterota bacterium]
MKKIVSGIIAALLFLGCSSDKASEQNIEPKIVIGKSLVNLGLKNQFDKAEKLSSDTKKIIISYSKDTGHTCSGFFEKQTPTYLDDKNIKYLADISSAPSIIRSMFVIPGLQELKYSVLILDDETIAAPYKAGVSIEKILVVSLNNNSITDIKTATTEDELKQILESN